MIGNRRGMTLIEILMAFAILVAGLTGIFALLLTGMHSHQRAVNETDASILAASVLADTRGEFFNDKEVRTDGKDTFKPCKDNPMYSYNRTIIALDTRKGAEGIVDREYFVRVEVRWSERGENKSLNVDTIMFRDRKR